VNPESPVLTSKPLKFKIDIKIEGFDVLTEGKDLIARGTIEEIIE